MSRETGMKYRLFPIDILFHDTILENTNGLQYVQGSRITRIDSVKDKTDNDFLPGRSILIPERGRFLIANCSDVFHDTMESTRCQNFVFLES